MKRIVFVVLLVLLLLPLIANAADGNAVGCNSKRLSKKAKKACLARAARAAATARRRAEEARRRKIARAIAIENGLRKTAADNILKDNTEGEDLAIRNIVIDAVGNNAATVVVMDPKTGEIKTIVNQEWAIRKAFQPCSTIKLLTTVAGLNQDIIDEEDEASQGDLKNALARSNNGYFQKIGANISHKDMIEVAQKLGLGKATGINARGEVSGKLPLVKKTVISSSHGYGYLITPLQQAVMISIFANHGKKVTPYIPRKLEKGPPIIPKTEQVNLPVENLDAAIPGMKGAADYGTASRGVDSSQGIVGKTGTCSATGTFTSVAPIDDPKYAVVVITRGNAGKGRYAAAIAGKIYRSLLGTGPVVASANVTKQLEPQAQSPK